MRADQRGAGGRAGAGCEHRVRAVKRRETRETRVRFQAASDQALLVYLGEEIGSAAHERVVQLLRLVQQEPLAWIRNIQPAYCSLLITFDAATVDHAEVQAKLSEYESRADKIPAGQARPVWRAALFARGFAYRGDLAEELAARRLQTPGKEVAAGSVGIGGRQTAVYPFATPGGWRLIGRTPLEIFRKDREPMGLIAIGDQVRFRPITRAEFLAPRQE